MRTFCPHNPPVHSAQIELIQRALKSAHLYGGKVDGVYGAATADAARRAKWRLGYPKRAVNHCAGEQLLRFLNGTKALPLAYKLRRKLRGIGLTRADKQRRGVVEFCNWAIRESARIHYQQRRPMENVGKGLTRILDWWADCSELVTTAYFDAGAPDPNGLGYRRPVNGYTGTLLSNGESIPLSEAKAGDVVIWGVYPGHHTAILLGPGADPFICSHGSEAGPLRLRLSQEHAAQQRPWVVKRYIH